MPVSYPYVAPFPVRFEGDERQIPIPGTVHYEAMDTVINEWMAMAAGTDVREGAEFVYCAASSCQFLQPAWSPDAIEVGLRASRIGRTSLTWLTAVFRVTDGVELATGRFVHVHVDRTSRRPRPLPPRLRAAATELLG